MQAFIAIKNAQSMINYYWWKDYGWIKIESTYRFNNFVERQALVNVLTLWINKEKALEAFPKNLSIWRQAALRKYQAFYEFDFSHQFAIIYIPKVSMPAIGKEIILSQKLLSLYWSEAGCLISFAVQ